MHVFERRIDGQQGLAQRRVDGVDGAVARRGFDIGLIGDFELHHGHGFGDFIALGVVAALVDHPEAVEAEERRAMPELLTGIELEGRIGAIKGQAALGFQRLDPGGELAHARVFGVDLQPHGLELGEDVGTPRLVRDQHLALVANTLGRDVFVGARVLGYGRSVQPALVREGVGADVGGVPVGRPAEDLVDQP